MRKKISVILLVIIAALIIVVPILGIVRNKKEIAAQAQMRRIIVWQIDGFEGGKGSRAQYLINQAQKCFGKEKTYVMVTTLTAEAARENFALGEKPDILSYSAGFYGAESYINKRDFLYKTWCRGGYCLLTLDKDSDFGDVTDENMVINVGKNNLTAVAATLCGVSNAAEEEPTNAYLKLISGKSKYLLGTQRDIFRLKTRNVEFALKPITQFNDLYQNISILTANNEKYEICIRFIDYLIENGNAGALGMLDGGGKLATEELSALQNIQFDYTLNGPCGRDYIDMLTQAAKIGDVNKLKSLLK